MTNLTLAQIRERLTSQSAPKALLNIITRMEEIGAKDSKDPGSIDFGGLLWDALLDELGAAAETPAPNKVVAIEVEGGVAEVVVCPRGIEVAITDRDGEQVGEGASVRTVEGPIPADDRPRTAITVVCRDNGNVGYEGVLVYDVTVPVGMEKDHDAVHEAVVRQRVNDVGEDVDPEEIEVLFAFAGSIETVADWRE